MRTPGFPDSEALRASVFSSVAPISSANSRGVLHAARNSRIGSPRREDARNDLAASGASSRGPNCSSRADSA